MIKGRSIVAACMFLAFVPSVALAHTGIGDPQGFLHGFAHPVTGLDHVLAMVMVGLLAFQIGGRASWIVPAAFVLVMAIGGFAGLLQIGLPFVETAIAMSVVVLGAAVALNVRPPLAAAVGLVGLFAIFHGHAHGAEMPDEAGALGYGLGFLTATAMLQGAGLALGGSLALAGAARQHGQVLVRTVGGLVAVAGSGILIGLL